MAYGNSIVFPDRKRSYRGYVFQLDDVSQVNAHTVGSRCIPRVGSRRGLYEKTFYTTPRPAPSTMLQGNGVIPIAGNVWVWYPTICGSSIGAMGFE